MPTVLRIAGFRIAFFAADIDEPVHVHVSREENEAKYWLEPFVRLSKNKGFRGHELTEIESILNRNRKKLLKAWNDYFKVLNPNLTWRRQRCELRTRTLSSDLADGRTLSVPLSWYPRLQHGTANERQKFRFGGYGIQLARFGRRRSAFVASSLGRASGESASSLDFWLSEPSSREESDVEGLFKVCFEDEGLFMTETSKCGIKRSRWPKKRIMAPANLTAHPISEFTANCRHHYH